MFVSTFETSLDSKGRVSVPAAFRRELEGGQVVYLYPALDGTPCLEGGGEALMAENQQTLRRMSPTSRARRILTTRLMSEAVELKLDETGRIRMSEEQLARIGVEKAMVFVGSMDRFHVWEPSRYAAFLEEVASEVEDVLPAFDDPFGEALASGGIRGIVGGETG